MGVIAMLSGFFDANGRPRLKGRLIIPELGVDGPVDFLVDTGSDTTSLHPRDSYNLAIPLQQLRHSTTLAGIGGAQTYFQADATLVFYDEEQAYMYYLGLAIARPSQHNLRLPSLLGQDMLRQWRTVHDPTDRVLQFTVRRSDGTVLR